MGRDVSEPAAEIKTRSQERVFSSGEGGSGPQGGVTGPILLAPGTTVKEALLIIHFRLDAKGDLDSM
jgi:hypothetical protein